jgi:hypothetical protein
MKHSKLFYGLMDILSQVLSTCVSTTNPQMEEHKKETRKKPKPIERESVHKKNNQRMARHTNILADR